MRSRRGPAAEDPATPRAAAGLTLPASGVRLLLGLGGCLDYEISWDERVVGELARSYGIRGSECVPDTPIETERDLLRSVLGYLRHSRGGERHVPSSAVLQGFADRFERRTSLGGTAVRAALALDAVDVASTVHLVSTDAQVRSMLPARVERITSATRDTVDPHLIVQFPAGATVQLADSVLVAEHPNRLIYVDDLPNRRMRLSPDLGPACALADAVLISGFNSMLDATLLAERLTQLRAALRSRRGSTAVIYEDAAFHLPDLNRQVLAGLAGSIDVHSMNEDEFVAYAGREVRLDDPADVFEALGRLREVSTAPAFVVHTRDWALAYGKGAGRYRPALTSGVLLAGARYRSGDAMDAQAVARVSERPVSAIGARFLAAAEPAAMPDELVVVPGRVVDARQPTTIGLGDTFIAGFVAAVAALTHPGAPAVRR